MAAGEVARNYESINAYSYSNERSWNTKTPFSSGRVLPLLLSLLRFCATVSSLPTQEARKTERKRKRARRTQGRIG